MKTRTSQLKHKPRGIIKWAPFNSLPEFTTQLKEVKRQEQVKVQGDSDGKNQITK